MCFLHLLISACEVQLRLPKRLSSINGEFPIPKAAVIDVLSAVPALKDVKLDNEERPFGS